MYSIQVSCMNASACVCACVRVCIPVIDVGQNEFAFYLN